MTYLRPMGSDVYNVHDLPVIDGSHVGLWMYLRTRLSLKEKVCLPLFCIRQPGALYILIMLNIIQFVFSY